MTKKILLKLISIIPSRVRITRNVSYEVLFIDQFDPEDSTLGECRSETKQIVLKKNQPNSELLKSFIHEFFHAVSFEYPGLNLTETQVLKLEHALYNILKLNGWFQIILKGWEEKYK